jgi:drug/metabolite transporter (DMT)-like permease
MISAATPDAPAPAMRAPGHALAVTLVVVAVLLWSTSFAATKVSLHVLPPMTVAVLRFLVSLAALGAVRWASTSREVPTPGDLGRMVAGGLLGITAYFAAENYGLKFATATDAALVVGAFPAIAVALEALLMRAWPAWNKLVGIVAATAGVAFIVGDHPAGMAPERPLGLALMVAAGVVWALYNVVTRGIARRYSMWTLMFYQTAAGVAGLAPLALMESSQWRAVPAAGWLAVLYLGLTCSLVAYFLYALGLRTIEASSAVTLMNLVPVFGVAFSIALLNEVIASRQILGGVIVLSGAALAVRARPRGGAAGSKREGAPGATSACSTAADA